MLLVISFFGVEFMAMLRVYLCFIAKNLPQKAM